MAENNSNFVNSGNTGPENNSSSDSNMSSSNNNNNNNNSATISNNNSKSRVQNRRRNRPRNNTRRTDSNVVLPQTTTSYVLGNISGNNLAMTKYNTTMARTGTVTNGYDPVIVDLTVSVNSSMLEEQAAVFAKDFLAEGGVRFHYVLDSDRRDWIYKLMRTYIYSFFKAFVLGTGTQIYKERLGQSYLFVGHGLFYDVLRSRQFIFQYDCSVYVNYSLTVSYEERESIINMMLSQFPFLRECITRIDGLPEDVRHPQYEKILSSITDHSIYTQKVNIINILDDNVQLSQYLQSDTIPLGNSFYGDDFDGFFISFSSSQDLTRNSYSWSRANFIVCRDEYIRKSYTYIPFNVRTVFSKFDATAIVGKVIRYNLEPGYRSNMPLTTPPVVGKPENEEDIYNSPIINTEELKVPEGIMSKFGEAQYDKDTEVKDIEQFYNVLNKLNLNIRNEPQINFNDVLPFQIDDNLDLISVISPEVLTELVGYAFKYGVRFSMTNYKFDNRVISTIDNAITLVLDEGLNNFNPDTILKFISMAWLSKKQKIFDLNNFKTFVTKYDKSIKVVINKNYYMTVYGNVNIGPGMGKFGVNLDQNNNKFI